MLFTKLDCLVVLESEISCRQLDWPDSFDCLSSIVRWSVHLDIVTPTHSICTIPRNGIVVLPAGWTSNRENPEACETNDQPKRWPQDLLAKHQSHWSAQPRTEHKAEVERRLDALLHRDRPSPEYGEGQWEPSPDTDDDQEDVLPKLSTIHGWQQSPFRDNAFTLRRNEVSSPYQWIMFGSKMKSYRDSLIRFYFLTLQVMPQGCWNRYISQNNPLIYTSVVLHQSPCWSVQLQCDLL